MDERPRLARRVPAWAPLAATCLGQSMVVLDSTIVNVALPAMRHALHLSATDLQWVVNAYLLTLGGLILLGGRIGDHFGRKRVYLAGGVIFSIASFAGGLAPTGGVLLAARGVQGIGAALLAPGTLSLLTSAYTEPRERTHALAVWSATTAGAGALGVFLGGVMTDLLGWRSVMFVNVPIGALVLVLGALALREPEVGSARQQRLDVPAALTVTAALTALVYGVVETTRYGWGSAHTVVVLAGAVVLFAITAAIEMRTRHPLIPFAVVRRGAVATAITLMVIHGAAVTATLYFQSLFLQQVRGYSPLDAGLLMLPFALLIIALPAFSAWITTRYGPRAVAMVALAVETTGLLWLASWSVHGNIAVQVILPAIVVAVGAAICFFAVSVMITTAIEPEHSGLGSGLFNAGRQIGGSVGLAALTVIAASHVHAIRGAQSIAAATAAGYGDALRVAAGLTVLGILIIAWHTRVRARSVNRRAAGVLRGEPQASEGSGR